MAQRFKSMLKQVFQGASDPGTPPAGVAAHAMLRPEGERRYLVATPSRPRAGKRPLVLVLHGGGASARQVLGMAFPPSPLSVWLEIAEREDLVVIAPDALKGGWRCWPARSARAACDDDVAFIGALIDVAVAAHGADPDRVYVIGVSMGGFMACRVALEMTARLAAFAAVLASMPCRAQVTMPATPLSALVFGCTRDPLVPYRGGRFFYVPLAPVNGIEDSVAMWREHNELPEPPVVEALPRSDGAGRTHAVRHLWGERSDRIQVGLVKIENAGHAEPSRRKRYPGFINALVGRQNHDLEVAEAAWAFFRDKRAGLAGQARF